MSSQPAFLAFIDPGIGKTVDPNNGLVINWSYKDRSILNQLPPAETFISLEQVTESGEDVFSIGGRNIASTSYGWDIKADLNQNLGHGLTMTAPYKYRVQATVAYTPKDFTCDPKVKGECDPVYSAADQALVDKAATLKALSPVFTIDMSKYVPEVITVDPKTTTITSTNLSVTGTSNTSGVMLQLLLPDSSPTVTIPVVNGKWTYTPASDIPNGTYSLNMWDQTGFGASNSMTLIIAR